MMRALIVSALAVVALASCGGHQIGRDTAITEQHTPNTTGTANTVPVRFHVGERCSNRKPGPSVYRAKGFKCSQGRLKRLSKG